jgi:uncharacterized protein (TIGR00255 family)
MTGFGDASALVGGVLYTVEARSVNNKYFKAVIRLPDRLQTLEPVFESQLRQRLSRGSITLTVSTQATGESAAHTINAEALGRYIAQLRAVPGVDGQTIRPEHLLDLPGVLSPPNDVGILDRAREAVTPLIDQAVDHLISMRVREGHALREDLLGHHALICERLSEISRLAPGVVADYEKRIKSRLDALVAELAIKSEPADLVREIAVYAERTDIAEEIARLGEHLKHFRELLDSNDERPIGRTLDFLSQELLREANTIASKSPDAGIARLIVDVKGAIDRIKEQVQNAE